MDNTRVFRMPFAGVYPHYITKVDFETFFAKAPKLNPNASMINGVICGYRVEDIADPLMQKIRYLDKLVDELAKGRAIEKMLRN